MSDPKEYIKNLTKKTEKDNLKDYGKAFQVKLLSLIIKDKAFAFNISPILSPEYFTDIYIAKLYKQVLKFLNTYHNLPSLDNLESIINTEEDAPKSFSVLLKAIQETELEDRDYIVSSATDFCFKKHAEEELSKAQTKIRMGKFDEAQSIAFDLFKFNTSNSAKIYSLKKDLNMVFDEDHVINPLPTVFPTFNDNMQGGPGSGKLVIAVAPSNFGKCFGKGTKIRMFDRTLKKIEDIRNGDLVMGADGLRRTVEGVISGVEELYKVQQKTGVDYIVNKSHILALKSETGEFENIEVGDYLKKSEEWKKKMYGYKFIFDPKTNDVNPYFLDTLFNSASSDNILISICEKYLFASKRNKLSFLSKMLSCLNASTANNILRASISNDKVAWAIYVLALSVGLDAEFYKNNVGNEVVINGKLEEKFLNDATSFKLEALGKGEYFGFSIKEENKLFLLEDFTVVHNTNFLVAQARKLNEEGKNVVLFSFEIGGSEIYRRHVAGLADVKQADVKYARTVIDKKVNEEKLGDFILVEEKATKAQVSTIIQNLNYLKSQGIFPDCILIDSLNQLKLPKGMYFNSDNNKFEYLAEEIRDLAKEERLPIYMVFQGNRSSFRAEVNDEQNIGKAIEPFQVADALVFFSQSDAMESNGKCYANLIKNRMGRKNILLECKYDPDKCVFEEIGIVNKELLMTQQQATAVIESGNKFLERAKSKRISNGSIK